MASNTQNQSGHAVVAPCGSGLFGWLLGLVGSNTPVYTGAGQPAARCGWSFFGGTPVYRAAPPPSDGGTPPSSGDGKPTQGAPDGTEMLRPIAIVVRREPATRSEGADGAG